MPERRSGHQDSECREKQRPDGREETQESACPGGHRMEAVPAVLWSMCRCRRDPSSRLPLAARPTGTVTGVALGGERARRLAAGEELHLVSGTEQGHQAGGPGGMRD